MYIAPLLSEGWVVDGAWNAPCEFLLDRSSRYGSSRLPEAVRIYDSDAYHDCIPSISTRITAQNREAQLFLQNHIFAIPDAIRELDLIALELINRLQFSRSVLNNR